MTRPVLAACLLALVVAQRGLAQLAAPAPRVRVTAVEAPSDGPRPGSVPAAAVPGTAVPAPGTATATPAGIPTADDPDAPVEAPVPTSVAAETAKLAAQLQKIQQLTFDRRPSVVLKTWSAESDTSEATAGDQPKPPADPFDAELAEFKTDVTLGNWVDVTQFLAGLPSDHGKAAFRQILLSFQAVPPLPANVPPELAERFQQMQQQMRIQQGQQFTEKHDFSFDDLLALMGAAPFELEDQDLTQLAAILQLAMDNGHVIDQFLALLHAELDRPEGDARLTRRQAARLLVLAGQATRAGDFLPDIETAEREEDHEALNLLARHYLALHAEDATLEHLANAWRVTQAILASEKIEQRAKDEALLRAVELAPKLADELGQQWLEKSFSDAPQRGMEILATIGSAASTGTQMQVNDANLRLKQLELQTTAVEALLTAAPELAGQWSDTLNLLAHNWLQEALVSYQFDQSTSRGPRMQRDAYGNLFYFDEMQYMNQYRPPSQIQAIPTGKLLECRPSAAWIALLREGLQPKFDMVLAQLYLKVGEEDEAFPHIERLAATYPRQAKDLVNEFLRVWTTNHDPNANRNRTSYYMFMYGFERRAESIPLTRSKQQRNLEELSELVRRLNALPLGGLDEELLAKAFTTCHSSAEVYRLEAIEAVFGSLDELEPDTLSALAQQMRANLSGVWRQPAVQEQNKTKRKQQDIQAEVLRGYEVARTVVAGARQKYPEDWSLQLAAAALEHDENNYRAQLAPNSEFSERRGDALAGFQEAARLYAESVGQLREDEQTTQPFEFWFYASMGACDLGAIDEKMVPDLSQPALIRDAILALPGEAAERHMAMFANSLFTRMSAVKPALKFRYLKAGFEIVGDHEQAAEARKVRDYYRDLVTEIKLECVLDGDDVVGHDRPFGLFVNLVHTREIERESGGFGRYLQNQNTGGNMFYYNYGRPLENYRDKFEELARQALGEHFEVLSVTFQSQDVNSKALPEYGWRVTPYAYILLKARGPEVDKVPPLVLNLDFLDTSGYVVLPIESPAVPIDASPADPGPRPVQDLAVTQILDERQADEGRLILEVKASAHGLVPDLDQILDLDPAGFTITETDDKGIAVSKFDNEADDTLVLSERSWMITMNAAEEAAGMPREFHFGTALADDTDMTRQRYVDADLLNVGPVVALEAKYGEPGRAWMWLAGLGALVLVGGAVTVRRLARRPRRVAESRFQMPDDVTPFTVLGLLRDIQRNNGLAEPEHRELGATIGRLERFYFASADGDEPDLKAVAESWLRRTSVATPSA